MDETHKPLKLRLFVTSCMHACMNGGGGDLGEVIGKNVKNARKARGYTQEQLARLAQVGQSDISRMERGLIRAPGAATLQRIADALGISLAQLVQGVTIYGSDDPTFSEFLKSPLADDISDDEIEELRQAKWPWGKPTVKSWYHVLEAIRSIRRRPP